MGKIDIGKKLTYITVLKLEFAALNAIFLPFSVCFLFAGKMDWWFFLFPSMFAAPHALVTWFLLPIDEDDDFYFNSWHIKPILYLGYWVLSAFKKPHIEYVKSDRTLRL